MNEKEKEFFYELLKYGGFDEEAIEEIKKAMTFTEKLK